MLFAYEIIISASSDLPYSPYSAASSWPNLHTRVLPAKIRRLDISGRFPMDMIIPPLKIKILRIRFVSALLQECVAGRLRVANTREAAKARIRVFCQSSYSPYSAPLRNRFGAVFGCLRRLGREKYISQNRPKG